MSVTFSTFREYTIITRKRFFYSLIIAFILHSIFFASVHYAPREEVIDIPVKALNIKLGDALTGEEEALLEQANTPESNSQQIEASLQNAFAPPSENEDSVALEEMFQRKQTTIPDTSKKQSSIGREGNVTSNQVARQYVRERVSTQATPQVAGDVLGNKVVASKKRVEVYTQTIALWLDKFKVYPEAAKAGGMQGRAMVRIRIDRRGNIHYRILSERTAYPLLDKAVLDMVRRANPVPAVPSDYPVADEYLEFVIPVSFKLD